MECKTPHFELQYSTDFLQRSPGSWLSYITEKGICYVYRDMLGGCIVLIRGF